jgi:hypothetical protein
LKQTTFLELPLEPGIRNMQRPRDNALLPALLLLSKVDESDLRPS